MAKKVDNTFIPKFVPNNLLWYERDGLNTWYEQNKCNDLLEDPDQHFENLQINNFDLIKNKDKLSNQEIKQNQMIGHYEIMKYPEREREEIMSSIFRNSKRRDMLIRKETIHEHFTINSRNMGRGRFLKKIKNHH